MASQVNKVHNPIVKASDLCNLKKPYIHVHVDTECELSIKHLTSDQKVLSSNPKFSGFVSLFILVIILLLVDTHFSESQEYF